MVLQRFSRLVAAASVAMTALAATPAVADDIINLLMDKATVIKAPAKTSMVVIGNPAIADVAVQKNGVMVLTGKSFGETNLLALDDQGQLVSESWLRVQPSGRNLTVYRAGEAETYSCAPDCRPTIVVGDSEKHFGKIGGQTSTRNGLANTNSTPQR